MATPQQLLAQAGRRAPMQDLSGAQDGTITGAHGGTQQLGPAALARLRMAGGGDQRPGIVPPTPGGDIGADEDMPRGVMQQRLANPLMAVDSLTLPSPAPGQGLGGDPRAPRGVEPPTSIDSYSTPGSQFGITPSSSAPFPAGDSSPSFNLPGFRPASPAASPSGGPPIQGMMGARGGEPPMSIDSYSVPTPDPNSARQALSTQQPPIARPPNPATSPFGASPSPPPPPSPPPSPSGALRPMIADQGNVQTPGGPQGFRLGGFRPKPFIRPQARPGNAGPPRNRSLGSL